MLCSPLRAGLALVLGLLFAHAVPSTVWAQAGRSLSDAEARAAVENFIRTQKKADNKFITTKGYWPRAIQVDAYELMLRLELEGRGVLVEPLYVAHFGSRAEALKRLGDMAEATQRPREAQILRERLLEMGNGRGSAVPSKKGSSRSGASFEQLAKLARSANDSGDLLRGEEVARQALEVWVEERRAGRTPQPAYEIVTVRDLLADVAAQRGDVLAAAQLLRQNIVDAASFPLTQSTIIGSSFPWACSPNLSEIVAKTLRFQRHFNMLAIDEPTASLIVRCLENDRERYSQDPSLWGALALTPAIVRGAPNDAVAAVRSLLAANWKREGDLSIALGSAYDVLVLEGKKDWIRPLIAEISRAIPFEEIRRTVETDEDVYGFILGRFTPVALLFLAEGYEEETARLHDLFTRRIEIIQKGQGRGICLTDEICNYLAMYADANGDGENARQFTEKALAKYGLDYGTGSGIGGYAYVTAEALRRAERYELEGRWYAAQAAYQVALKSSQKTREGKSDFFIANRSEAWSGLAKTHAVLGEHEEALAITTALFGQLLNLIEKTGGLDGDVVLRWSGKLREVVSLHLLLLASSSDATRTARAEEALQAAQFLQMTAVSSSTQKLAARLQAPNPDIRDFVRKHQDLRIKLISAHRGLALSQGSQPRGLQTIAQVEAQLQQVTQQITSKYPDYLRAVQLRPHDLRELSTNLVEGEILAMFVELIDPTTKADVLVRFFISPDGGMRWGRGDALAERLQDTVMAIRCGVDIDAWSGTMGTKCEALQGYDAEDVRKNRKHHLPFDFDRAYDLYQKTFGGVEVLTRDKEILLVTSGALSALPPHVLLTKPPHMDQAPTGIGDLSWLGKEKAITILPSIASLKALRDVAHAPSKATKPFIGLADPVLVGHSKCEKIDVPDTCPAHDVVEVAEARATFRIAAAGRGGVNVARNGLADVQSVRRLCSLPDTAHEVTCVARDLNADARSVVLREKMTETFVKSAKLDQYRIVHFATHGLIPEQTASLSGSLAEPALVLSPPEKATATDDGLLTASEIAMLRLDADWVVLSACNTASGGGENGEALAGLAQSFFYAGSRAVLVSHWSVNSNAATRLTIGTFGALQRDRHISRAEALRRSMVALMTDQASRYYQHPAMWAPFVVVGASDAVADSGLLADAPSMATQGHVEKPAMLPEGLPWATTVSPGP